MSKKKKKKKAVNGDTLTITIGGKTLAETSPWTLDANEIESDKIAYKGTVTIDGTTHEYSAKYLPEEEEIFRPIHNEAMRLIKLGYKVEIDVR
jgi:hypothetical protein